MDRTVRFSCGHDSNHLPPFSYWATTIPHPCYACRNEELDYVDNLYKDIIRLSKDELAEVIKKIEEQEKDIYPVANALLREKNEREREIGKFVYNRAIEVETERRRVINIWKKPDRGRRELDLGYPPVSYNAAEMGGEFEFPLLENECFIERP